MSQKTSAIHIHSIVEEFIALAKWVIENIEESWKSWQYIVHKCPEVIALYQKPGTVMPFGTQAAIDRLRSKSSLDQINQKIRNDPALQNAFRDWGNYLKSRPEVDAKMISLGENICKSIIMFGWGGENATDPFLNLGNHGNQTLPLDNQKSLYESARKQAIKFDLYIQAYDDKNSHESDVSAKNEPPQHIQLAYQQYRATLDVDAALEHATQARIYAAIKRRAEGTGQEIPAIATFFRYVRLGKSFYEQHPPPSAD